MEWLKQATSVEINEGQTEVAAMVNRVGATTITLEIRDGSNADADAKESRHNFDPENNILSVTFGPEDLATLQFLLREASERSHEAKSAALSLREASPVDSGVSLH